MDFETVQDHLVEYLKLPFNGVTIPNVFEVAVPPGFILPMDHGVHLPYALISFGGQSPVAMRNQGITTTRDDLKWTSVAVEAIGNSPRDVRYVTRIVRGLLEGYKPDASWGELQEQLAGDYTVLKPEYELWPVRYATGIVFNTNANAVT